MRIDHVIYAAPDLDEAVDDIERRFGVRPAGGGQHVGQGTHNRLLALGPRTYLEIVAPDPRQPEPAAPRPYGVDDVTRAGVAGWALECDDVAAAASRSASRGFDPGEVIEGHRVTADGTELRWELTSNALRAGVVPFLIGWGATPHPAATAPGGLSLDSLRIEHPDPGAVTHALLALGADVEVHPAAEPALVLRLVGPLGALELR